MTQQHTASASDSLRDQAIRWIVRLRSGAATSGDRRDFDAWLASNPEHRREFDEVSRMWAVLDNAQPLLQSEIQKAEDLWADHDASRRPASRWSWGRCGQGATVGMALLLLLVTAWWWTGLPEPILYETAKGARQQIILADGSTLTLNTDTKLTVQYARHERLIRLHRGEAWFTVRHDERRPFTVQVANGTIRDIGTEFVVNKSADGVRVSVWEGIVEVGVLGERGGARIAHPALLHAGQEVSYGADSHMSAIGAFDRNQLGSWREGKLVFRAQPLKQVLAEIARYRPEEIRLLDARLEEFPVSGVFNIGDIDQAMQVLQDALPVRAQRVRDNLIIVERASVSSTTPAMSHR